MYGESIREEEEAVGEVEEIGLYVDPEVPEVTPGERGIINLIKEMSLMMEHLQLRTKS